MFKDSILEAKRLLANSKDKAHDIEHAHRVSEDCVRIGKSLGYENLNLLELCGWWHDVGRLINDDNHENISANMLKSDLLTRGYDGKTAQTAYDAIVFHKWSMNPKTLEGDIVRDADKLDFISIERWRACIESSQLKHLKDIKALLNKLPELFALDESKNLFTQRFEIFIESDLSEKL